MNESIKKADKNASSYYIDQMKEIHKKIQDTTLNDPYNPQLWATLGRVKNEMKDFADAIKYCKRALELSTNKEDFATAIIHFNYGIALMGIASVDSAIDHFKIAANLSKGTFKQMVESEIKKLETQKATALKMGRTGEFITYRNNVTGSIEKHYIEDLQDFVSVLAFFKPSYR